MQMNSSFMSAASVYIVTKCKKCLADLIIYNHSKMPVNCNYAFLMLWGTSHMTFKFQLGLEHPLLVSWDLELLLLKLIK